jgi:DegV family protein with EDD domain
MAEQKIAILTDSSAHIPESSLQGLNVSVIPVWLIWDDDRFRDGVDIDPETFYRRLKASKTLPTSSQPSPQEFVEIYQKIAQQADVIVSVLVSEKISGTIASAKTAQEQLPDIPIHIVDTFSSSMGSGLVVLAAARTAAAGKSVEDIIAAAKTMREKVHFLFMVDTLEYLRKGGRVSNTKWLLGTALSIKPLLQFKDGLIQPLSQARTKRKALAELYSIAERRLDGKQIVEAAIVDIDAPDDGDAVAEAVKQRFGAKVIHRSTVSPVVGTHVGPGAIGLAFYAED